MRSMLFVPGDRPDRFSKAVGAGADAVIIDLEDAVGPDRKASARSEVAEFLGTYTDGGAPVFIRINGAETTWFNADLEWVGSLSRCAGVVLPKAESAEQVEAVARAVPGLPIIPIFETARGILSALAIADARATSPAVILGAEDLTAQLGVPRTIDGDELVYPRAQVALAATAIGAAAIDAVLVDITATDDLRRDARRAKAMGFHGKMAIHPSQLPVIHEVFTPTAEELAHAQRLVDAFEAAQANGDAVIRLDDRMVDMPLIVRARRVLAMRQP